MKLIARIAFVGCFVIALSVAPTHPRDVHADSFNDLIEFHVTMSGTDHFATPDITTQLNIDCLSGVCPATSSAPVPDLMLRHFGSNILPCRANNGSPCSGNAVPIDALLGSATFQLRTNVVGANAPDNVNAATGVPPACGAPGTTAMSSTFPLISGAYNSSDLVAGRDGPDADTIPDTQADLRGLTPGSPPNGAPDAADAMPDYLKTLLGGTIVLVAHRAFGVAPIGNTGLALDINVVTIDLTSYSAGYVVATIIDDALPLPVGSANGSQSVQTCTPFSSTIFTAGHYADNPATPANEGAGDLHVIVGTAGNVLRYGVSLSGAEDVDNDGLAAPRDRCPNPDVGVFPSPNALTSGSGAADSDGDGIGDSCDPDPLTADNCPGAAFAAKSSACASAGANPASYPTRASGCTTNANTGVITCTNPWNPDQDIDGDGFPNWSDNCPTASNTRQIDRNDDGIGDACQTSHATAAGLRIDRPSHDHDEYCEGKTTIGATGNFATTCYAPTPHGGGMASGTPLHGSVLDSNDDGFPDFFLIDDNPPEQIYFAGDKNSDSDNDGCSDYAEVHAAMAQACAGDPDVANSNGGSCVWADASTHYLPVSAGVPANSCVDGNKDRDGNGIADWRDDVTGSPQNDSPGPTSGSTDSDGDGCSNRRELLPASPVSDGGGRDATNKWDFFDVDTSNAGIVGKSGAITIADTIAILSFIGTSAASPDTPNADGHIYGGDDNSDGTPNGEIFDRSPGPSNGAALLTGPPDGAVTIADAILNLSQIGANCSLL